MFLKLYTSPMKIKKEQINRCNMLLDLLHMTHVVQKFKKKVISILPNVRKLPVSYVGFIFVKLTRLHISSTNIVYYILEM